MGFVVDKEAVGYVFIRALWLCWSVILSVLCAAYSGIIRDWYDRPGTQCHPSPATDLACHIILSCVCSRAVAVAA